MRFCQVGCPLFGSQLSANMVEQAIEIVDEYQSDASSIASYSACEILRRRLARRRGSYSANFHDFLLYVGWQQITCHEANIGSTRVFVGRPPNFESRNAVRK